MRYLDCIAGKTSNFRIASSVTLPILLLEGVVDRDWGIAFSVVNDELTREFAYRIFLFYKK
jgi:hypothetical protein